MNDKLFRSQTPHSVAFDETTKNATSPHNELVEADKAHELHDHVIPLPEAEKINSSSICMDDSGRSLEDKNVVTPDSHISIQEPLRIAKIHIKDTRVSIPVDDNEIHTSAASMTKAHLSSHVQKMNDEHPSNDKLLYESLERLQDRVHRLQATHHHDNRQELPSTTLKDNYQHIESSKSIVDRIEYLEKKNIKDHMVKFGDSKHPQVKAITDTQNQTHDELDSNVSFNAGSDESQVDSRKEKHQHSNELQDRIDRLKKDMHNVNDSLKDIQSHNDDLRD